jgi:hypothetical protein
MNMVKLRSEILRADRASADRWYVTNGATAVGPVALELVERGIEAGKIPVESYIRHEMWKIWRPLSELCVAQEMRPLDALSTPVIAFSPSPASTDPGFDPRRTTMKPAMSAPEAGPMIALPAPPAEPPLVVFDAQGPEPVSTTMPAILDVDEAEEIDPDDVVEEPPQAAASAPRVPPPPPSVEDITLPARPPRATEKVTGDPLSGADQLKDALLTLSSVILREVGCEGVMVHRVDDEGAVAVVAHGPRMFDVIGLRTRLLDPAIVAAAAGILVVAEPTPGPAGQSILSRLEKLGVAGAGAAMIPIRPNGRLFGTVELGQATAFDGAAIWKAEALVRVVQAKMEAADWKV